MAGIAAFTSGDSVPDYDPNAYAYLDVSPDSINWTNIEGVYPGNGGYGGAPCDISSIIDGSSDIWVHAASMIRQHGRLTAQFSPSSYEPILVRHPHRLIWKSSASPNRRHSRSLASVPSRWSVGRCGGVGRSRWRCLFWQRPSWPPPFLPRPMYSTWAARKIQRREYGRAGQACRLSPWAIRATWPIPRPASALFPTFTRWASMTLRSGSISSFSMRWRRRIPMGYTRVTWPRTLAGNSRLASSRLVAPEATATRLQAAMLRT